jgi:oligopeptidase A
MTIPFSISPACRASRDVRPEHVAPRSTSWWPSGRATIERLAAPDSAHVGELRRAARRRQRAPRARLVAGEPPERGVNSPEMRDAYNAALPKVTQYFSEQGQDQRLHAASRRCARARLRRLAARAPAPRGQRAARLPPRRRGAAAAREGALPRDPGGARQARSQLPDNVLDATNASAST